MGSIIEKLNVDTSNVLRTLSLLWLTYNKIDNGVRYQSHLLSLSYISLLIINTM